MYLHARDGRKTTEIMKEAATVKSDGTDVICCDILGETKTVMGARIAEIVDAIACLEETAAPIIQAQEERIAALEAENARVREALNPFADAQADVSTAIQVPIVLTTATLDDFRHAREVLGRVATNDAS